MRLLFFLTLIGLDASSKVSASLTTSFIGRPCPGEEITLTCTVTADELTWEVPGVFSRFSYIRNTIMLNINVTSSAATGYLVTVTAFTSTTITSTLMVDTTLTTIPENGVTVTCVSVGTEVIQLASPPSPPLNISYSVTGNSSAEGASVSVQWDPPTDDGGRDDLNYTVTISPQAQLSATVVTSTSVNVSAADYNKDYTVSVVATNCAGNSTAEEYSFRVVRCSVPMLNPRVMLVSTPSPVYLVDTVIMYGCTGSDPSTSTCGSNGKWSPDTTLVACPITPPPVVCGVPSPPVNGSIVGVVRNTSEVRTVIQYRCDEGLFPMGNLPSECSDEGIWRPDPAELMCTTEPLTCFLPSPPANGFVVQISNLTIVFGCNEGFSPQENKTANCVASDQWRPSTEEIICTVVDAMQQDTPMSLSTGALVGVSVAVTAVVFTILGFLAGLLVMYLITRKKAVYSTAEIQTSVQPTAPAGPVYEDVSPPKEEIELNINQAYGPVGGQ